MSPTVTNAILLILDFYFLHFRSNGTHLDQIQHILDLFHTLKKIFINFQNEIFLI